MQKQPFEILIVAIFYLLSRFQTERSVVAAEHIVEHLEMLLADPKVQDSAVLKNNCSSLLEEWQVTASRCREKRFQEDQMNKLLTPIH